WQPLSDEEWEALSSILWALGCGIPGPESSPAGRKMANPRARLDAIFRGCTMKWDGPHGAYRAPWRALPDTHGKPDTISRTHRRWAHAGLWRRLLEEISHPQAEPALRGLAHWICCAYRRAIRVMGLRAVLFARRLGQSSALPAPSHWLPEPALLKPWQRLCQALLAALMEGRAWFPPPGLGGVPGLALLRDRVLGRRPLPRWAEPA
ncbi:MAG: transposase, partial [Paracraurococcus sp.]